MVLFFNQHLAKFFPPFKLYCCVDFKISLISSEPIKLNLLAITISVREKTKCEIQQSLSGCGCCRHHGQIDIYSPINIHPARRYLYIRFFFFKKSEKTNIANTAENGFTSWTAALCFAICVHIHPRVCVGVRFIVPHAPPSKKKSQAKRARIHH